ncbi:MAG: hypothetical protein JO250_14285 [Armatimonadetes bacterium]|nr:hypothetical protein [Armatimonadota bacterium]
MSPTPSSQALREATDGFLWRQWAQLGVSGHTPFADRWVIDPEALLLGTLELSRRDPRLFDEVLDWCVRHGRRLSVQRLKTLARAGAWSEDAGRALSGLAGLLAGRLGPRWRVLADTVTPEETHPLFRGPRGEPLPVWGTPDPHFLRAGLKRAPVELRGLTGPVPLDRPACLLLRLRTLFGLSPRAEAVAFLLARGETTASEAARAVGYTTPGLVGALSELAEGGFIAGGPRRGYRLDPARWATLLGADGGPPPAWVRWPAVFAVLSRALRTLEEAESGGLSEYLGRSALLRLHDALRETLAGSGLPGLLFAPARLETAPAAVQSALGALRKALSAEWPPPPFGKGEE